MADEYKIDFVFKDEFNPRGVGWTESLFQLGAGNIVTALIRAESLARARCQMLGRLIICTHIRASNVDFIGDSSIVTGPQPPPNGLYNPLLIPAGGVAQDVGADFPWSSLEVRMESTSRYRRAYWLSGNPDFLQFDQDLRPLNGPWQNAFDAWQVELTTVADRWAFKVRSKDPTQAPLKPVTAYNASTYTFTCPAHGLIIGDRISFRNGGFTPRITGKFTVATIPTANTFTLEDFTRDEVRDGDPKIQKVLSIYTGVTRVLPNYYGSKKRGGISFAVRGRR